VQHVSSIQVKEGEIVALEKQLAENLHTHQDLMLVKQKEMSTLQTQLDKVRSVCLSLSVCTVVTLMPMINIMPAVHKLHWSENVYIIQYDRGYTRHYRRALLPMLVCVSSLPRYMASSVQQPRTN